MNTANIGKPENLNIADLNNFHANPRLGDVEAIAASLQANGQYKPIVVNRGTYTNRPMEVLAGNHTLKAMRLLTEREPDNPRFTEVACWVVDVDDDRANRIVLADNRTADLGTYQNDTLKELLESLENDFDGTGYTTDDVELLEGLTAAAPSLDDLAEEFGEPEDDDFWITLRFRVPPILNDQWKNWAKDYESPEEAFEALMDNAQVQ